MKKIKKDPLNDPRQKDRAVTVFTKYYAKRRGKYRGWSDVRAETLIPEGKIDISNELEVR